MSLILGDENKTLQIRRRKHGKQIYSKGNKYGNFSREQGPPWKPSPMNLADRRDVSS